MDDRDASNRRRTIGGWPWQDVALTIVGLVAGGYIGADVLDYRFANWDLIATYTLFVVILAAFALVRPRYRPMLVGAYAGMTLAVGVMVLFVAD